MDKEVNIYTISDIVESMVNRLCNNCNKPPYCCERCMNRRTLEYVKKLDKRGYVVWNKKRRN